MKKALIVPAQFEGWINDHLYISGVQGIAHLRARADCSDCQVSGPSTTCAWSV